MMFDDSIPQWLAPYAHGEKAGWSQNHMSYAEFYGVDVSANDGGCEERIAMLRPPMVGYASRTGTRRNLTALRNAGWRLLVSAKDELRTEGMRYALDNGAWSAFVQQQPFDEDAFLLAVDRLGEGAD